MRTSRAAREGFRKVLRRALPAVDRTRTQAERQCRPVLRRGQTRDRIAHSTLYPWLHPEKPRAILAQLDCLSVISDMTGVSLDWLVGRDVDRQWSNRAPVGELAAALCEHVLRDYIGRRDGRRYVDGIARVLNGNPT